MLNRENYYMTLELDPTILDWKTIEAQIEKKRVEWNKKRTLPQSQQTADAELFFIILPDIIEKLKDPQNRKEEAEKARIIIEEGKRKKFDELDKHIKMALTHGISEERFKQLLKEFGCFYLSEKEIEDRFRQAGVRIGDFFVDGPYVVEDDVIERTTMDNIRDNLNILKCKDLYVFLNAKQYTSADKLKKCAEDKMREANESIPTVNIQAIKKLAGHCAVIFKSEEEKQKYDNSLKIEAMDSGFDSLITTAGSSGIITQEQVDELIQEAGNRGVKSEDAQAHIYKILYLQKIKLIESAKGIAKKWQVCGFCRAWVASDGAKNCGNCGKPMIVKCRNGHEIPSQDEACKECGAKVGDTLKAMELLDEAKKYWIENKDSRKALDSIELVLYYWENWDQAINLRQEIENQIGKKEVALDNIKNLIHNKLNLVSAKSALDDFKREYPSDDTNSQQKEIEEGLKEAEALYIEAESLFTKKEYEAAYNKYQESLSHCRDFTPAIEGAARCPPSPPSDVKAEFKPGGNIVLLTWKTNSAGASESVIYRKTGTKPTGLEDAGAKNVAGTGDKQWEDHEPPVGKTLYYAIYEKRGELLSKGAISNDIFIAPEVSEFKIVPLSQSVYGTVKTPYGARIHMVYKKGSPPSSISDGTPVTLPDNQSIQIKSLINGEKYYFLAVCEYTDEQKKPRYSTGVVHEPVTPCEPPQPVLSLTFQKVPQGLQIIWEKPPVGGVQIYKSDSDPSVKPGDFVTQSQLALCGQPLPPGDEPKDKSLEPGSKPKIKNTALDPVVPEQVCYYTPVSSIGMAAVFGQTHEHVELPEVSDVKVASMGSNQLRLLWRRPGNIHDVKVVWAYGTIDGSTDINSKVFYPTDICTIEADCTRPIEFRVHTRIGTGDREKLSSGVRCSFTPQSSPPEAIVTYTVKPGGFLASKAEITIQCLSGAARDISLTLRGQKDNKPINNKEGNFVAEFNNIYLKQGETVKRSFIRPHDSRGWVSGLFLLDESGPRVKIEHPEKKDRTL